MKMIFICSPYRGDTKRNIERAKKYCSWAGYDGVPIAPHLYFTQFLDEEIERWRGLWWGTHLMQYCDEIWIFCDELTEGMIKEVEEAKKLKLKMKFYNANREELTHGNYIIHSELGPGYRRLISESFGDRFYFDGCADCSRCKNGSGGDADTSKEEEPVKDDSERTEGHAVSGSIWGRIIGFFR